ncbi:hypothetical protein GDO78_013487 [Eleutherodactylus coqui]|uniref:Uncharacterized protein n=1 Tax=Eleutherodactylus coqui TaxID=57060 RepID=A0A8J6K4J3_ELECQ|nr:hypothetical protein GDO78_013487 [Eleutherodactylus coqui]
MYYIILLHSAGWDDFIKRIGILVMRSPFFFPAHKVLHSFKNTTSIQKAAVIICSIATSNRKMKSKVGPQVLLFYFLPILTWQLENLS